MQQTREHVIAVAGAKGVGKSTLIHKLVYHYYQEFIDPTLEEHYHLQVSLDGNLYTTRLQEVIHQGYHLDLVLKQCSGVIIVYDVTRRDSFEEVTSILESVYRSTDNDQFPVLIVGNKADLEDAREVATSEGKDYSRDVNVEFLETSAKSGNTEEQIMKQMLGVILELTSTKNTPKRSRLGCICL